MDDPKSRLAEKQERDRQRRIEDRLDAGPRPSSISPTSVYQGRIRPLESRNASKPDNTVAKAAGQLQGAWRAWECIDFEKIEVVAGPLPRCRASQARPITARGVDGEALASLLPPSAELGVASLRTQAPVAAARPNITGRGWGRLSLHTGRYVVLEASKALDAALKKLGKLIEAGLVTVATQVRRGYEQEVASLLAEEKARQVDDAKQLLDGLDVDNLNGVAEIQGRVEATLARWGHEMNEETKALLAPADQRYRLSLDQALAPFYTALAEYE